MIDPLAVLDAVFSGLEAAEPAAFPGSGNSFPGEFPGRDGCQNFDYIDISRNSRISRSEIGGTCFSDNDDQEKDENFQPRSRASRACVSAPGNPGNPGNETEKSADTAACDFPVPSSLPGKIEENREIGCRPDSALFCSERWPAAAMAEADRTAASLEPLPISAADVRAGVVRELRVLAEDGREGPAALRDAIEITRAKIRNSEALAERQANGAACHVCDAPLDDATPVVAVLSGRRNSPLHLHAGCCGTYSARRAALVEKIMASAGCGAADISEKAA